MLWVSVSGPKSYIYAGTKTWAIQKGNGLIIFLIWSFCNQKDFKVILNFSWALSVVLRSGWSGPTWTCNWSKQGLTVDLWNKIFIPYVINTVPAYQIILDCLLKKQSYEQINFSISPCLFGDNTAQVHFMSCGKTFFPLWFLVCVCI